MVLVCGSVVPLNRVGSFGASRRWVAMETGWVGVVTDQEFLVVFVAEYLVLVVVPTLPGNGSLVEPNLL